MSAFKQLIPSLRRPRWTGAFFGVALMLLAAAGGARQSVRITEEIQEIASHSVQVVMGTEESRTPSHGRQREVSRDVSRAVASRRCQSRGNHHGIIGHFLHNGLNAPLRC